jgi:hypothetical protein
LNYVTLSIFFFARLGSNLGVCCFETQQQLKSTQSLEGESEFCTNSPQTFLPNDPNKLTASRLNYVLTLGLPKEVAPCNFFLLFARLGSYLGVRCFETNNILHLLRVWEENLSFFVQTGLRHSFKKRKKARSKEGKKWDEPSMQIGQSWTEPGSGNSR